MNNSYGYGGRIGYYGQILPGFYLGASYQTKIYMSELSDYEGLLLKVEISTSPPTGIRYCLSPVSALNISI